MAFCAACLAVEPIFTVSTAVSTNPDLAKGSSHRTEFDALMNLMKSKRFAEAEKAALTLQAKFEAEFDPALKHYSFHSQAEYEDYKAKSKEQFEWIDWAYKQCFQMRAFIMSEKHEYMIALSLLEDIEKLAPASADTACETGFVLGKMNKFKEGEAAYRRAYKITIDFPSQKGMRSMTLRGLGFALGEQDKNDEAEKAYLESLELEPGNSLATNELAYIRNKRKHQ